MDFKVTGTRDGITATQMDIKVDGPATRCLKRPQPGPRRTYAYPRQNRRGHPRSTRRLQVPRAPHRDNAHTQGALSVLLSARVERLSRVSRRLPVLPFQSTKSKMAATSRLHPPTRSRWTRPRHDSRSWLSRRVAFLPPVAEAVDS